MREDFLAANAKIAEVEHGERLIIRPDAMRSER